MHKPAGSIFISYDTVTGLEYAREAKRVFNEAGYLAWMWDTNRTPGSYPAEEIAKNIEVCDVFCYLCTSQDATHRWNGQQYERNFAWNKNKPCQVLTFDPGFVPLMLQAYGYVEVSPDTFARTCRQLAKQFATQPQLETLARYLEEDEPLDSTG